MTTSILAHKFNINMINLHIQ